LAAFFTSIWVLAAVAGHLEAPTLPFDARGGRGGAASGCEFGRGGTNRTWALLWELPVVVTPLGFGTGGGGTVAPAPAVAGTEYGGVGGVAEDPSIGKMLSANARRRGGTEGAGAWEVSGRRLDVRL
jgi:hypothetical protein